MKRLKILAIVLLCICIFGRAYGAPVGDAKNQKGKIIIIRKSGAKAVKANTSLKKKPLAKVESAPQNKEAKKVKVSKEKKPSSKESEVKVKNEKKEQKAQNHLSPLNISDLKGDSSEHYEPLMPNFPKIDEPLLTLQACYDFAYANHPDIGEKAAEVSQSEAKLRLALAQYDPDMTLNFNKTYLKTPPAAATNSSQANVALSHTIYDWSRRAEQVKAARENLEASRLQLQSTWIDRAKQINDSYLEVMFYQWTVVIQRDDLNKALENLRVAQGFYDAGANARIDVTQAEIEVAQSRVSLVEAENNLRNAWVHLAAATGMEVAQIDKKQFEDVFTKNFSPSMADVSEAISVMEKSHPSLAAYRATIRGSKAYAGYLARLNSPTLNGTATYGTMGLGYPKSAAWNVGVTLSIPIFYDSKVAPQVDEQKAVTLQYQKMMESQKLTLISQIQGAYSDIDGARGRESAAKTEVLNAIHNYVLAYKRYKMGVSQIIELNTARDYLNTARSAYLKAIYDRKIAEVTLQNTMGLPDIPEKKEEPEKKEKNVKNI